MFRGAEPLGGVAARRRKRASRGYMLPLARVEHGLPLRQRMLLPMPQQRHTLRATPSTRFCNRANFYALLQNRVDGVARDVYFYSFRKSAYQPAASPISFRLRSAMA